jgi:spore germination protein KC
MSGNVHHRLFFAHTKVIILDEELVTSKGIMPVIDFCERNPEIRLSTWILISPRNQFDKILNKDVGIGLDTGGLLDETIHNKMENSFITVVNLGDFIELFNSSGSEAYVAGVSMTPGGSSYDTTADKQSGKEKFYITDVAVFKADKMVGWLTKEEYKGFSWINGNAKRAIMSVPFGEGTLSLRIVKVKHQLKPVLDGEKMKMNINMEIVSDIAETQTNLNFMNEDTIREIEQLQSEKIKSQIIESLEKSRNLNSDIFEMGSYFNMKYPELWKDIKDDWYSYYPDVEVSINVDSTIKDIGNVYRTTFKR